MKVSSIEMSGFTRHHNTRVDLPDRGLVLITGQNGAGKSSLVEAVAWTLWGKTLRGTKPWASTKGYSRVTVGSVQYCRSSKKPRITWEGAPTYEKDEYAQNELTARFGSFEHWRRACVVSSSDASSFASATDAERKRMLEDVAGSATLEQAYQAALAHVRGLEREHSVLKAAKAGHEGSIERLRAVLSQPAHVMPPDDTTPADPARLEGLRAAVRDATADLTEVQRAMTRAQSEAQAADRQAREARAAKAQVQDSGHCPTCKQSLPAPQELVAKYEAEERRNRELHSSKSLEFAQAKETVASLSEELEELREVERGVAHRVAAHEADRRARIAVKAALKQREVASQQLAEAEKALEVEAHRLVELERLLQVAKDAAQTLSTKGVRAQILDSLISTVEQEANRWLFDVCGDRIRLELRAYGETADGARKEQVSFAVHGAGNGLGYKAASGGERRRIDVAITLALALVAEAAAGKQDSTIFLDEAYDALDTDGVDALTGALLKLAQDRCVVVIAHGDAARDLQRHACKHYKVTLNSAGNAEVSLT